MNTVLQNAQAAVGQLCNRSVTDAASAEAFIKLCVKTIGLGFHPDTAGEEYVFTSGSLDGKCMFTLADAKRFNTLINEAFKYVDPYTVALKAMGME